MIKDCELQVIDADLSKLKIKGLIFEIELCTDYYSVVENISEFSVFSQLVNPKEVQNLYKKKASRSIYKELFLYNI